MNTKTENPRFFGTKTEKTFLKIAKTKNPNAPFLLCIIIKFSSSFLNMINIWTYSILKKISDC